MVQTGLLLANEALNALSAHVAVTDTNGVVVFANAAWERFARRNGGVDNGYLGTNYLDVCRNAMARGDDDAARALAGIEEVLRGECDEFTLDYPCSSPDQERWFRMAVTRFDSGLATYLVVAHEDVTAEKRSRRALEDAERLLRSVLEALPVGVWILDSTGRIVEGNAAGVRIWAGARFVGPEDFGQYKGWWLETGEPIAAHEWAAARAIARGETSIDEEVEIECFDGTHKIILNSGVPLYDSARDIAGAIIVNQDITARKRAERDRERMLVEHDRLRLEAETANRLKDDFIATLSHELRTPLQSVLGWTRILTRHLSDRVTVEQAAASIQRNARLAVRLVDETLDLSRIARGTIVLEESVVDFLPLLHAVLDTIRPAASEKGITLAEALPAGRALVQGDPTRLQQIVWNLLTNAVKFTLPGGRITVQARVDDGWIELSVRDTGAGIAPELLPFIFDRFRRGDGASERSQPGLGLGLSIAKELVERHHGTIRAQSSGPGQGATFTVRLPRLAEE